MIIKKKFKKKIARIGVILIIILLIYLLIPLPSIDDPTCTVLESNEGKLLGAKIADDGQWRFPVVDTVPEKFTKAIITFEDQYFYYHPGFNPVSLFKSLVQNIKAKKVIRGGSTLTMQVVRLSRKGKSRTYFEKFIEIILATKLELKYSKNEILAIYASNAPFGGNVVGIEAASWRYYGRPPTQLSWAETATLAVLPNAPSLIYPGKNQQKLYLKRNKLLKKLNEKKIIDSLSYLLSIEEPLPQKPKRLPQLAPHLVTRSYLSHRGKRIASTIDYALQQSVNRIIKNHHNSLKFNEIHNAAAIVLDVETGNVLAYTGNTQSNDPEFGSDVDIITAPRSTGSILKPFLYAVMLNEGEILPGMLVADIPTQLSGFSPKNYSLTYDGAVPAKKALSRSLNVPSVRMLQNYGVEKFHELLNQLGLTTITFPAQHYGLSLILGGAEGTLWDITGAYANLARILNHTIEAHGGYSRSDIHPPKYIQDKLYNDVRNYDETDNILRAASIWFTIEALLEVNRPEEDEGWQYFSSSKKIAWKTGTSFGFRDAWAIGVTPEYVVGVWAGNADGEGRPGLTGVGSAAPIMFDIFNLLQLKSWFQPPYDEIIEAKICKQSGHLASHICDVTDTMDIPEFGIRSGPCPYHYLIHIDKDGYRVNTKCEDPLNITHKAWFILPPAMEWFYKIKNPTYKNMPSFRDDCIANETFAIMEFIYPKDATQIYIPVELDGTLGETVFEVAHRNPEATLYWHLDDEYIGLTNDIHQFGLRPMEGKHTITIVDQEGNSIMKNFEVLSKK